MPQKERLAEKHKKGALHVTFASVINQYTATPIYRYKGDYEENHSAIAGSGRDQRGGR